MKITSTRISTENFSKYGTMVTTPSIPPLAKTEYFAYWSDLAHYSVSGETEMGYCTVFRHDEHVRMLERHLRTPEILIPIDAPFVLPVQLQEEAGEPIALFEVSVGEAVVIDAAVWHGACLPVGKKESSYFVIFRRGTPQEDVIKKHINPVQVAFERPL